MINPAQVYASFNARHLSPAEVARTFVPPPAFSKIVKPRHTLVVGPRGSGKTTLLKMLTRPAIRAWTSKQHEDLRRQVDFIGVFIPYDRSWKLEVETAGLGVLSEEERRALTRAAFVTHVHRSLADAMRYELAEMGGAPAASRETESSLVQALAKCWGLDLDLASYSGLTSALGMRQIQIGAIVHREALRGPIGRARRIAKDPALHIPLLQSVSAAVDAFEAATGRKERWALLLDELELAPEWIRNTLLEALRSADARFIFKMALSPFAGSLSLAETQWTAHEKHDFEAVPLWYTHKEDSYEFCRQLLAGMLSAWGIPADVPETVLGASAMEAGGNEWRPFGTSYAKGTRVYERLRDLSGGDATFRDWLAQKDIDLETLNILGGDERAKTLRKVAALVAIRDEFLGDAGKRSRKNPSIYAGATSFYAVSEGNPRLFIGMLDRLRDKYDPQTRTIAPNEQALVVRAAAGSFRDYLRTLPCPKPAFGIDNVAALLDVVGKYFAREILTGPFNPDPHGTFIVSREDQQLMDSLGGALNAGAIVYVRRPTDPTILETLIGKRFRLSYLLASQHYLPLNLYRAVHLRTVLRAELGASGKDDVGGLFDESSGGGSHA